MLFAMSAAKDETGQPSLQSEDDCYQDDARCRARELEGREGQCYMYVYSIQLTIVCNYI